MADNHDTQTPTGTNWNGTVLTQSDQGKNDPFLILLRRARQIRNRGPQGSTAINSTWIRMFKKIPELLNLFAGEIPHHIVGRNRFVLKKFRQAVVRVGKSGSDTRGKDQRVVCSQWVTGWRDFRSHNGGGQAPPPSPPHIAGNFSEVTVKSAMFNSRSRFFIVLPPFPSVSGYR